MVATTSAATWDGSAPAAAFTISARIWPNRTLCVDSVLVPTSCCQGATRSAERMGLLAVLGDMRPSHQASIRLLKSDWVIVAMSSSSPSSRPHGLVSFSCAVVYREEKCACSVCALAPVYFRAVQPHDRDQMRRL